MWHTDRRVSLAGDEYVKRTGNRCSRYDHRAKLSAFHELLVAFYGEAAFLIALTVEGMALFAVFLQDRFDLGAVADLGLLFTGADAQQHDPP